MTLTQLRAFLTVFETGSFSAAALELGTMQSTVSYAVAELERELGTKLLERGRFGARPTPTGEQIAGHARQMLLLEAAVRQEASLAQGVLSGTLRVGTFRSVASHIVPQTMMQLARSYPELKVQLLENDGDAAEQERVIRTGRVELAFLRAPYPSGLLSWDLLQDPYIALMPKDHPLAMVPVCRSDLLRSPLVVHQTDDSCSAVVNRYLEAARGEKTLSQPNHVVREDSTISSMVGQGLGLSIVPELAFLDLPENVIRVPLAEPLERTIGVAIMPTSLKVPAVRAFLGALKTRFPESTLPPLGTFIKRGAKAKGSARYANECPPEAWLEPIAEPNS